MNDNTINSDVTMGSAEATLLVNRYRVVRQLVQGGMGSVWLAEDTQLDNREVAIKMLPSILVSNKRAYQQLKAEALVSLKLTHPNIATVRAFEENNGNPFLVVDYIDGATLDDYLAERCEIGRAVSMRPPLDNEISSDAGRAGAPRPPHVDDGRARTPAAPHPNGLPEIEVIRLLAPIAAALDYAHAKGVVHRDVKPGNVMIAKDGTPYILDFGIAREIQETMTRVTGKLSSGTLMYMSPEQLNGDAPSAAQDVYSFAAMAYECLTGAPPFSRGNIEYQIVNKEPAPLDSHIIISESIMAGLVKKPEDRPANCAAVLSAGGGHGVTSLPLGNGDNGADEVGRARAPREPRRWGVWIALSVIAVLVIGGFGYLLGRQPSGAAGVRALPSRSVAVSTDSTHSQKDSSLAKITNYQPGDVKTVMLPGGAKLELVWCPPGSFMMGSPSSEEERYNDETQHRVTLTKGFWIGKYEVTQKQWQSVMGTNPSKFIGPNRPVDQVSWEDCQQFCRKAGLGLRLPTEAEWEYACRAGTTTPYSFGSVLNGDRANCDGNYPYGTTAKGRYRHETSVVGEYGPNAWGLYDMHGNVWEWCSDWYGEYKGAATDPTGPSSGESRVNRGGGWSGSARYCRSADCYGFGPGNRICSLGFRVCCSAGPYE